jgi:hypothetical protein
MLAEWLFIGEGFHRSSEISTLGVMLDENERSFLDPGSNLESN